jgi:hypothetical protein
MAKWEAFRSVAVFRIQPDVIIGDIRQRTSDHLPFCITAFMYSFDYKRADAEFKEILRDGKSEQNTHHGTY